VDEVSAPSPIVLHHVGPGYTTVVRLPGPVILNDLGPSTRGVDP